MIGLKPYGWIDEGSTRVVHYMIGMVTATSNYKYKNRNISYPSSNTVLITIAVEPGTPGANPFIDSYTIPAGSSSVNTVIIQVVIHPSPTVKGSLTLRLGYSHFSGTDIRPHCWIKMASVPTTEVYFAVDLSRLNYTMGPSPTYIITDPTTHTLTLAYTLTYISVSGTLEERVFNLSGYDPTTYQFIAIAVSGGPTLQGKGTTSQDDADSSGDD